MTQAAMELMVRPQAMPCSVRASVSMAGPLMAKKAKQEAAPTAMARRVSGLRPSASERVPMKQSTPISPSV